MQIIAVLFFMIFPIGVIILAMGLFCAIFSTASISKPWGVVSCFLPPVAMYFCLTHWRKCKFALSTMGIGIALIAISYMLGTIRFFIPGL